eukprot:Sdes_comp14201_c0_seq1m3419
MSPSFTVDPFVVGLSQGNPSPVWGLNLTILWPMPEYLRNPYENFVQTLCQKIPNIQTYCYFYPFEHLHSTVCTFVNFKADLFYQASREALLEDRQNCFHAWLNMVKSSFHSISSLEKQDFHGSHSFFPLKPFQLTIHSPRLSSAAAIFSLVDSSNSVKHIRNLLQSSLEHSVSSNVSYHFILSCPLSIMSISSPP